jgi:hypothetical protein
MRLAAPEGVIIAATFPAQPPPTRCGIVNE